MQHFCRNVNRIFVFVILTAIYVYIIKKDID